MIVETLFLPVLSILVMESGGSIRLLYRHFFVWNHPEIAECLCYVCSFAQTDYFKFVNTTAAMALNLIPENLRSQLVFLRIDDTMISKFGSKSEDASKQFYHAAHIEFNYLNVHCLSVLCSVFQYGIKKNILPSRLP